MNTRELSYDERIRWGECPVCHASHGEYCHPDVGIQMGRHIDGSRIRLGEGVHMRRINAAPTKVTEIGVEWQ